MFAILRVAKLKTPGNVGGLNAHLTRTMDVPNADPELAKFNSRPVGSENLWKDVQQRFDSLGITPRKNAVLAIDHIITASPEAFPFEKGLKDGKVTLRGNVDKWKDFQSSAMEWLTETYGKANIVNFTVHHDELTPHIHAVITPIDSKGKLNCRDFLGGRDKLRDMQTTFAKKVEHLGLKRGIEGSKAIHQDVKRFYEIIQQAKPELLPEIKIEVKSPEKGMLGIGYKLDPQQVAEQETERINNVLKLTTEKANRTLLEASILNNQPNTGKNHLKGLEATLNKFRGDNERLKSANKTLANEKTHANGLFWQLVQKVAKEEFTPQKAKELLQKEMEARKQKEPEKKKDQGMSM